MKNLKKFLKIVLFFAGFWLFLLILVGLQMFPPFPATRGQWIAFVVLGPPACLLAEGVWNWLDSIKIELRPSRWTVKRTKKNG